MVSLRAEREQAAAPVRRARWQFGILVGIVLAAVAGLLLLAGGRPVPGRPVYEAGTTDPVAAAVPVLAGHVEQARGLRFRRPPVVRVADPEVIGRTVAESATEPAGRAATERALAFSGWRPATSPPAVYNPRRQVVYVRQDQHLDAYVRVALVHALTRALQDQSFDLPTLTRQAAADPDRQRALSALLDGDATRIELAYLATLPAADQAAVRSRRDYSPSPASYGQLVATFPHTAGRSFAEAPAEQGGNPAVDAAFRRPPTSTAQVIDPRAYLDGVEPLGVRPPPGTGSGWTRARWASSDWLR